MYARNCAFMQKRFVLNCHNDSTFRYKVVGKYYVTQAVEYLVALVKFTALFLIKKIVHLNFTIPF